MACALYQFLKPAGAVLSLKTSEQAISCHVGILSAYDGYVVTIRDHEARTSDRLSSRRSAL